MKADLWLILGLLVIGALASSALGESSNNVRPRKGNRAPQELRSEGSRVEQLEGNDEDSDDTTEKSYPQERQKIDCKNIKGPKKPKRCSMRRRENLRGRGESVELSREEVEKHISSIATQNNNDAMFKGYSNLNAPNRDINRELEDAQANLVL
eukprot:TRINITY_DN11113_c0_g1_i1.p1 TRINITY_DN11113_c0_g1~~TRINITY_DN11113_c0_g1_i1.p1  ORF type:complete len:153 (+),score=6.20 TRINITY_DN11113_c0_g1_i1:127-585(+)